MCLGVWAAEGIEAKRAKTEDRVVPPTRPGWAPGRKRWYHARPVYRALQPMRLLRSTSCVIGNGRSSIESRAPRAAHTHRPPPLDRVSQRHTASVSAHPAGAWRITPGILALG